MRATKFTRVAPFILAASVLVCVPAVRRHAAAEPKKTLPPIVDLRAKESAADELWDRMPMAARRTLFVMAPAKQFGAYEPRGQNEFRETEKVVTYVEPVGFVFRDVGNGVLTYGFKVALVAKKADGTRLLDKPDYAVLESRTRSRKHDVEFTSSLDIKGLAPGTYTLEFTFTDLNSDKRMMLSQTFRVVP